ncbi:class I SAM-dependent RNA methyltransferase [Sphingosinicella sp. BN140058]|uniref:class I SAM-dependent RNA methyltransferase n=1 Tax=Sphingosinicella sp. BN140058 TaxID=1892855 RepID=UPI001010B4F6|nr:class I SAM-dependent RNA methyltransferase [Sphingosinicella sp. BN140058]QAY78609.1 class I SAM-dependent RNA methyltransferase [Sphingosinicella sp. BN140058]
MSLSQVETIVRLAGRGDGVTESGRFVPLAAPGDGVTADGSVLPGPHHVKPPCRHFPECGGCQLQHLDDESFGAFLRDRIAGALGAQGLAGIDILPAHISPPNSRRRASLRAERRGKQVLIGFNAEQSHRIVDMHECHILRPELFALVPALRPLLARMLPARGQGGVRMSLTDQGVDLLLEKVEADDLSSSEALTAFAQAHRLARLSIDDGYGPQTRWEPDPVTVTLGGAPVPLPHNAFLQATLEGEASLVAAVRDAIGGARIVADLFAGLGTFALSLDGRVLAVEGARDAALALKAAANRSQRQLFVDHRDLFRRPLTTDEANRFEAIILDPPRAGAKDQVPLLAAAKVPRIAYVSCNPGTFARDAKALVDGGYRLEWVKPVGQFRWSTHVELVASFAR